MVILSDKKIKKLDSKTVIKKHIEVVKKPMHLIQLNKGLNLRQQRFFNLAILNVKDGVSEISRNQYNELFGDDTDHFYSASVVEDIEKLIGLNIQTETAHRMIWDTVFLRVQYDKKEKVYRFHWSPYMKERIENVRKNYIQQDLKTLANFRNKYSFILYDYFKSNHLQWKWILTKEEILELLRVGDIKSYKTNQTMFYKQCIESPIHEINEYTEYRIEISQIRGERNKVIAYEFKRYTEEDVEMSVTPKQIQTLQEIVDRYGDFGFLAMEISKLAIYDAEAVPELTTLLVEIQGYKNLLAAADKFTSESFREIIALAIKKDNTFKAIYKKIRERMQDNPTIDMFIKDDGVQSTSSKPIFYNWLEERE